MSTGTVSPQDPAVPIRHRLNIDAMTSAQLAAYRAALTASMKITDERGYNFQAGIHGLPLPMSCGIAHGQPIFLPWHRAYLYFFELTLRAAGADVTLPWWDWTADQQIPTAYRQARVQNRKNPLHSAKVDPAALAQGASGGDVKAPTTVRHPGQAGSPPLPTAADIEQVLELGDFLDFTQQLEQLHNNVHVWVGGNGGHMADIPFAAFDPIFWAHHAMIDRVWRLWQLRHPQKGVPASLLDEALPPFGMTVRQTLDAGALGYDYAVQATQTNVTEG
jgi:tyrosinase